MKLLFVHDGPIFYDADGNYYEVSYHRLRERYGVIADEITFLMRTEPLSDDTQNTLVPKEIQVVSVPNIKTPQGYLLNKRKAEKIIREEMEKTDFAILRGGAFCSSIAYKYAVNYKKPYIYECVGCVWDSLWNYDIRGKIIAPITFLREKKRIRNAPYVYYVTDRFLQKRYPTNGKAIGCADVVTSNVPEEVLMRRIARIGKFRINGERLVLGTAAAVDVRYKGQEHVIRALPKLIARGYDVEYRLAGSNRHGSTYLLDIAKELGVEDRVILCGSLSADEMPDFYDALDVYIQPSMQEGLPRAMVEAMSRGCPALGTNIAGIPELLEEQYLFQKCSAGEVVSAVERMLRSDMSAAAAKNFHKAKQYVYPVLDAKRKVFYEMFLRDNT